MLGLAPASDGLPSQQLSLYQAKLQAARREAAQAQAKVQSLESQTETARQESSQAQSDVRQLEGQPPQRNRVSINTRGETTGRLLDVQV